MSNQQEEAGTGSGLAIRPVHAYIKTLGASGTPFAENPGPTPGTTYCLGSGLSDETEKFLDLTGTGIKEVRVYFEVLTGTGPTSLRVCLGADDLTHATAILDAATADATLVGWIPVAANNESQWLSTSQDPDVAEISSVAARVSQTDGTYTGNLMVEVR